MSSSNKNLGIINNQQMKEQGKKSDVDIFEETAKITEKIMGKDNDNSKESQDGSVTDLVPSDSNHNCLTIKLGSSKLIRDYSARPNLTGMDWANCSWADPDDSLF